MLFLLLLQKLLMAFFSLPEFQSFASLFQSVPTCPLLCPPLLLELYLLLLILLMLAPLFLQIPFCLLHFLLFFVMQLLLNGFELVEFLLHNFLNLLHSPHLFGHCGNWRFR